MMDYRIEMKIKNAPLYDAMIAAGFSTVAELSRFSGASQSEIGKYMNLKESPFKKDGNPKDAAQKLESALGKAIEDLFPEDYQPIRNNFFSASVSQQDLMSLCAESQDPMIEVMESEGSVDRMIEGLPDRQALVIKDYFEEDLTHCEIAKKLNVSTGRVQQIMHKALRHLRHPSRRTQALEYSGCDTTWIEDV